MTTFRLARNNKWQKGSGNTGISGGIEKFINKNNVKEFVSMGEVSRMAFHDRNQAHDVEQRMHLITVDDSALFVTD